jgi:hypothetical protein
MSTVVLAQLLQKVTYLSAGVACCWMPAPLTGTYLLDPYQNTIQHERVECRTLLTCILWLRSLSNGYAIGDQICAAGWRWVG